MTEWLGWDIRAGEIKSNIEHKHNWIVEEGESEIGG